MPRRVKCITFDCYGTLIDWHGGIEKSLLALPALGGDLAAVRRLLAMREEIERGLITGVVELPNEDNPEESYETPEYRPYREILADSLMMAARDAGIPLSEGDARAVADGMAGWEPFPDTRGALEQIGKLHPIGILSNAEESVIAETIRRIGIRFDLVVTAEKVEAYKPAPDHWYAAMHELEADEHEILHLAASPFHDLETATLLGIPCVYINRAGYPLGEEASPLFEVPDLAAAAARIESRSSAGTGTRPAPRGRQAGGSKAAGSGGAGARGSRKGHGGAVSGGPREGPGGPRRVRR
jgi:2-haloalkanoic acid dehalogenase type II